MDRDIPIPQEILDAEAPCDCGYPMSAHQRPDWFCYDWRKKHDELAELVLQYFQAKANLEMLTNAHSAKNNAKSFQAKLNATHGMVKADAALRKAVEEK
jgi:hypothetical protein